jgi:hypothetical protein
MEHSVMKNDAFYILWYVNLYLYMDLMEIEINTIQYQTDTVAGSEPPADGQLFTSAVQLYDITVLRKTAVHTATHAAS